MADIPLNQLREIQYQIYKYKKKNKRTVTAADIFKPNRRSTFTYGLYVKEVSLTRGAWEVFEIKSIRVFVLCATI